MDSEIDIAATALAFLPYLLLAGVAGFFVFGYATWMRLFGIVLVPDEHIALVNKKFVLFGANKTLPEGRIIAVNGEAGWQVDPLPPGFHPWYWPWQYEIEMQPFFIVGRDSDDPEGEEYIGVVSAIDGAPISSGRVLGRSIECDAFQNGRAFLAGGGERGPQLAIIPPGTYRINTRLFNVELHTVTDIPEGKVGIVTTKEGQPLPVGEIAGLTVDGHSSYQDAQAFVTRRGWKGLQEQPLLAGRYNLNPLFVDVRLVDMTLVPIAHVGVVIAYVGEDGQDQTGDDFKHGNLVKKGHKGVWIDPLDPGRYAINPETHKVELVPTANVVLNWADAKSESHNLDRDLSTIKVRSSDGFTFNLDVSQIIHVGRQNAPKVIARFGNMSNLVTQVLEPTVGNYFRNAAQAHDVIAFLTGRQERQREARAAIEVGMKDYDVVAVDTLIGDITPPQDLMKTLTDRKIAQQQKITFGTQKEAAESRKDFEQANAMADTQKGVVAAERQVTIAGFEATSAIERARGSAEAQKLQAGGAAEATRVQGDATASATLAVGQAEAQVVKEKIESMQAGNFAGVEIAKALASSKQPLVPTMVAGGSGEGGNSLVSLLLMDAMKPGSLNGKGPASPPTPPVRPGNPLY